MIKYSLIALAAAAVLFSVGCDDGECCNGVEAPVVAANVAPVISRVLGATNNSTVDCTPGATRTLAATDSDVNGNLDTNSYSWTVDGVANTSGTVDCPADGETKKICVTVKDDAGLESNEVCVNLVGQAQEQAVTCNPAITMKDTSDNVVTTVTPGQTYSFDNNVTDENCPNQECTWSVRSHNETTGTFFTCLMDNSHVGTGDEPPLNTDGTYHVNLVGIGNTASISVQTCASEYDYFEVTLNCTNPAASTPTKRYDLQ